MFRAGCFLVCPFGPNLDRIVSATAQPLDDRMKTLNIFLICTPVFVGLAFSSPLDSDTSAPRREPPRGLIQQPPPVDKTKSFQSAKDLPLVPGLWQFRRGEVAVGGVQFPDCFYVDSRYASQDGRADLTFRLDGKFDGFSATLAFGLEDPSPRAEATLTMWLDGERIKELTVRANAKPQEVLLDTRDVKSLMIRLERASENTSGFGGVAFLFESTVYFGPTVNPVEPNVVEPRNGAVLVGGQQRFAWRMVPDATAYALLILPDMMDLLIASGEGLTIAISTKTNSADVDISKLPKGRYRWAVLPIKVKQPTSWSREWIMFRK